MTVLYLGIGLGLILLLVLVFVLMVASSRISKEQEDAAFLAWDLEIQRRVKERKEDPLNDWPRR